MRNHFLLSKTFLNAFADNTNYSKLWKLVRSLKNEPSTIQPLRNHENILLTPTEKCEAIKKHFENAHYITSQYTIPVENKVNRIVNNFFRTNPDANFTPANFIKPSDIIKTIKQIKSKKSAGLDKINNTLIKNLPRNVIIYLNLIMNSSLKLGYFSSSWKIAKVVPIPKVGKDLSLASNYRPISLLSCLGKLFEKLIVKKLRTYVENSNIITKAQFAFQPNLSTTHKAFSTR